MTLVELLVVVAIVAAVVGIVLSVIGQARERGRTAVCASNIRQLVLASLMYARDYDGRFPPFINAPAGAYGCSDSGHPGAKYWAGACAPALLRAAMAPYVGDDDVFFCPSDPFARKDSTAWNTSHLYSSYMFNFSWDLVVTEDGLRNGEKVLNPAATRLIYDPIAAHVTNPGYSHLGGINVGYADGHVKLHMFGP